jgi:hypothetical protein
MSRWASRKTILEKSEGDNHETLPILATQDTVTTCYFSRRCYLPQLVLVITDDVCLNTKDSLLVGSKGDTALCRLVMSLYHYIKGSIIYINKKCRYLD